MVIFHSYVKLPEGNIQNCQLFWSFSAPASPGPPRDNFILRPEELQWSEQDFLGGRVAKGRGKWTGWPRQTMRWKQWIYHSIYFLSISIYIYLYLYLSIYLYIYIDRLELGLRNTSEYTQNSLVDTRNASDFLQFGGLCRWLFPSQNEHPMTWRSSCPSAA
jgi:hypothetical protein